MKRITFPVLFAAALTVLGCSSVDLGSLGDILGSTGPNDPSDIRGKVTRIDSSARRIDLDVDYVNNLIDTRKNSSIYYDSETVVQYEGQTYSPTDLERGDVIEASGSRSNDRYIARTIRVVQNVRDR